MKDSGADIEHVVNTYKAAVYAKDESALIELYSPDVRVFDLWGEWSYEGADAWGQAVKAWFGSLGSERVVVQIDVIRSFETSELVVVEAFIVYLAVSHTGEPLRAMKNRLTWVLEPVMDTWKIAHEHTSAPADLDSLKVLLQVSDPS